MELSNQVERRPPWLKVKLPSGPGYAATLKTANEKRLHTVCEEALCPNIAECWGRKTATFMILGDVCTRACGFCSVKTGRPTEYDLDEPRRTAEAIRELGIRHAVITSVTRDDLADGGAAVFAETVRHVRARSPGTKIELLIPDLRGRVESLQIVWNAKPDVLAHNVECVERLQSVVRSASDYQRSLFVLAETKKRGLLSKSGLQVGHGETWDEILATLDDLARIELDVLTIGQYLKPTREHLDVRRFYTPDEFAALDREARARAIPFVFSGPLVRSSYRAEEVLQGRV